MENKTIKNLALITVISIIMILMFIISYNDYQEKVGTKQAPCLDEQNNKINELTCTYDYTKEDAINDFIKEAVVPILILIIMLYMSILVLYSLLPKQKIEEDNEY